MAYSINRTEDYHLNKLQNLGWELTVCSYLEDPESPVFSVLKEKLTYGNFLFNYLGNYCNIGSANRIIEVGGGYGYLMRDFCSSQSSFLPVMIELSPGLMQKQKEILKERDCIFINEDFFNIPPETYSESFCLIMNEIVGDFPTICNVNTNIITGKEDVFIESLNRYINMGIISKTKQEMTINIGALMALERVCISGIDVIFISEHSCETEIPQHMRTGPVEKQPAIPQKISLYGHCEYTIAFSHLVNLARYYNYTTVRGVYADFIPVEHNEKCNFVLSSGSVKDEHEIIRHFLYDLYNYEYLILLRDRAL